MWFFGAADVCQVHLSEPRRMAGYLELKRARVRWFLSVDPADLPADASGQGRTTFRSITVDGTELEFTEGFTDLHTRVYEGILAGHGHGIDDARPSIELVHRIRRTPVGLETGGTGHPLARTRAGVVN
jgi:UDP-N-acetyl-2-amino-2-deoxyglucuronate dehydrogenase